MNFDVAALRRKLFKISLSLFFLLFIDAKCRKDIPPDPNIYVFTINAVLNKTFETISLGDTLKIQVKLPDTITAKNYLNEVKSEKVSTVQIANYNYSLFYVDTVARIDHYLSFSKPDYNIGNYFKVYPDPGNTLSAAYIISLSTTPPYAATLNIIPKAKGVFYIQIFGNSSLTVNQNFSGRFAVHYTSNKHLDIVTNNIDSKTWIQAVNMNADLGSETYAFRVN